MDKIPLSMTAYGRLHRFRVLYRQKKSDREIAEEIGVGKNVIYRTRLAMKYPPAVRPAYKPPKPETWVKDCIGGCGKKKLTLPVGRFTCDVCYAANTALSSSMGIDGGGRGGLVTLGWGMR